MGHHLTLSFEFICLLNWLLKHKKEDLKKLIHVAIADGFVNMTLEQGESGAQPIEDRSSVNAHDLVSTAQNLHKIVIDFVVYLEDELLKELEATSPVDDKGTKSVSFQDESYQGAFSQNEPFQDEMVAQAIVKLKEKLASLLPVQEAVSLMDDLSNFDDTIDNQNLLTFRLRQLRKAVDEKKSEKDLLKQLLWQWKPTSGDVC